MEQYLTVNCTQRKKRKTRPDISTNFRHSTKRVRTVPVYKEQNIHVTARDKKSDSKFRATWYKRFIDHVLQLESLLTRNLCEQSMKDNTAYPQQLRIRIVTVAVIDNLDYNSSSTAAQDSFCCTAISILQHPAIKNQSGIRPSHFSTKPSLKEVNLPEYYSIIPATTTKKLPSKFKF